MAEVAFVFSNPRHHFEMMAPVAAELRQRGVTCELVSLAELRGFETPKQADVRRVIPLHLRRAPQGPSTGTGRESKSWRRRRFAQQVVWHLGLAPRLRWILRGARVIVVPNDAVYPYTELVAAARKTGALTVLMQEGIRFQQPEAYAGPQYGAAVSGAVCAWGEGSKDYFVAGKVPVSRIAVTGAPRLDALDPAAWQSKGSELLAQLGMQRKPLAFLSNPIEYQGYGTKDDKLALFAQFLAGAAPVLRAGNIPVLVKNHLHEDPADYERVAATSAVADLVKVAASASIFAALAASAAAVVLTSTVGLEALLFGVPIAVLEIPGHPFAFEYVQRGAAQPVRMASVGDDVGRLLAPDDMRVAAGQAFVARHLYDRGRAGHNVADVIERVLASARGENAVRMTWS